MNEVVKIDARTALYALFGHPVAHSLGPAMHNAALKHHGLNGVYLAFDVACLAAAVESIRVLGIKGVSVTIPHKVSILKLLDKLDKAAQQIGAVNTITCRDGLLTGYNTDVSGALNALNQETRIAGKQVLILGAGGAARAIGYGIVSQGGRLTIVNRTHDKARALAQELDAESCPFSLIGQVGCQILINTTPVGMWPHVRQMPVAKEVLTKDMLVMDIVYNPSKTQLLREARRAGARIIDGVSMFVHQGAAQFELWTGKKAPVDLMRQVVMSQLKVKND